MRAVRVVVGAGRNQFDGIAAEDRKVAKVLFPLWKVPGVVGIGLWTEAELMAAQLHLRGACSGKSILQAHTAGSHLQLPKQSPHSKQNSALVSPKNVNA